MPGTAAAESSPLTVGKTRPAYAPVFREKAAARRARAGHAGVSPLARPGGYNALDYLPLAERERDQEREPESPSTPGGST